MSEEEQKKIKEEAEAKAKAEAEAKANSGNGEHDKKVVDDAKAIVDGMNEANKVKAELLEREEKLQTRKEALNALGGGSVRTETPEKKKETDEEFAERFRSGDVDLELGKK